MCGMRIWSLSYWIGFQQTRFDFSFLTITNNCTFTIEKGIREVLFFLFNFFVFFFLVIFTFFIFFCFLNLKYTNTFRSIYLHIENNEFRLRLLTPFVCLHIRHSIYEWIVCVCLCLNQLFLLYFKMSFVENYLRSIHFQLLNGFCFY